MKIPITSVLIASQHALAMSPSSAHTDNIISLKSRLPDLYLDITVKQHTLSQSVRIGAVGEEAPTVYKGTDFEGLPSGHYVIQLVRQPEGLLAAAGIRASRNLVCVTEGTSLSDAIKIYLAGLEKTKQNVQPASTATQPTPPTQTSSTQSTPTHELTLPVELNGSTKIVIEVQQVEVKPSSVILAYLSKQNAVKKN